MNPQTQFCHNPSCPARGQVGQGNMRVQSQAEQRYRCTSCGRTFAATTGTPFYRLRTAADLVTLVLTLLSHGCPTQEGSFSKLSCSPSAPIRALPFPRGLNVRISVRP